MGRGVAKGKKLILAPSDLVARLTEISNREGRTFYSFASEIFGQALRAHEMKYSLKEIVDFFESMETQKASGAVITPIDALTYLISEVYQSQRDALLEKWYESGEWYGKYLLARFHERNTVEVFGKLLESGRWDLKEVHVTQNANTVKLRCVSPLLPLENTELLLKFIEGAMCSLGYKVVDEDYLKGIILLKFERS